MTNRFIHARRTVSRRVGIGIIVLFSISGVMLVAVAWLFLSLDERQRVVFESVREDALWAAYQADHEAGRLLLSTTQGDDWQTVVHRFDLFYSRVTLLSSGTYALVFGTGEMGVHAGRLANLIKEMTSVIDNGDAADIPTIRGYAFDAQAIASNLLLAANAADAERRLEERRYGLSTYWRIGASVAALTVTLVLIAALLGLQLRHSSRTGREIELLSQRNARIAKRAQAASEAKSAFLATMSHEIRTPLNGILGIADLLQDEGLPPEQHHQVDIIRQSGTVLLDVINDILDYSKLEAGSVRFEPRTVSLSEAFDIVALMMRPRAEAAHLRLDFNFADCLITADANRLRQVLVNLVGNAIKFTEAGSVIVSARVIHDTLRIEVSDTGPGISEDAISRLFRDFSQLDNSSTRSFGGTGLGLAICKRLVELMGGVIGVVSTLGAGSTFWLEVPVGPTAELPAPEPAAVAPVESTAFSGRVMVVDDNQTNREVCCRLLQRLGVSADNAVDGEDAITKVESEVFDLVLMDMQMPKLDGLGAARILRERGFQKPIVGLTANAYASDRDACLAAGMDEHMAKPVTRQKLEDLLRRHLPAPPANPSSSLRMDIAQQNALALEIGEDALAELIASFETDMESLIRQAEMALAEDDQAGLDRVLHTLKGAAQTLGLVSVADVAQSSRGEGNSKKVLAALDAQLSALRSQAA